MAGKKSSSMYSTLGVITLVAVVVVLAISLFFPMKRQRKEAADPFAELMYANREKLTGCEKNTSLTGSELKRCMRAWWEVFGSNKNHNIIVDGTKKTYAYTGEELRVSTDDGKLRITINNTNYDEDNDFVVVENRVLWIPADYKSGSKFRGFHDFNISGTTIQGERDFSDGVVNAAIEDLCVREACGGNQERRDKMREALQKPERTTGMGNEK